jgi:hypothetical protein
MNANLMGRINTGLCGPYYSGVAWVAHLFEDAAGATGPAPSPTACHDR